MSTLSNESIFDLITKKQLIENGKPEHIGPACYELRMGNTYYDLTEDEGKTPIKLDWKQKVLIKPGHRVVLITNEKLLIPNNILAKIISKGSLFSIGLSPVCTNADPGFSGNIGLVTQNLSDKYIEIEQKEPIAKVDFSYLDKASSAPYVGQHGFHTEYWPIKTAWQKTYNQIQGHELLKSEADEAELLIPPPINSRIHLIERKQKKANVIMLTTVITSLIALASINNPSDILINIACGLIANVVGGLIVYFKL